LCGSTIVDILIWSLYCWRTKRSRSIRCL